MEEKETEFRYKYMSIPLPLSVSEVFECTDIYFEKDDKGKRRNITNDESEWLSFLCEKSAEYYDKYEKLYNIVVEVYNEFCSKGEMDDDILERALSFHQEQMACAILLITRCREIIKDNNIAETEYFLSQKDSRISELEAALADYKAENDKLRAENEELKKAPQAEGGDDIPYTLWREVLAMRKEGMTDKQIAGELNDKGQGLSQSQLGALLYTGKEKRPASKTLQDTGTKLFR